jgi:FkbM family methyltransferase
MKLKKQEMSDGGYLWFREDDVHIGQRMAIEKYEPYLTQLFLRQLRRGMKVADVGANIGHYTLAAAKAVGKKGWVRAFEPEETNFEILTKNIKEKQLKNAEAVKAAVGSKNGTIKLKKSSENFGDHRVGGKTGQVVKMVSLDKYLGDEKVDLIKIDVQGWEPEVIEGARAIISKWKPVVIMEFCPSLMKEAGTDSKIMWDYLESVYGTIWAVDEYLYTYKKVNFNQAVGLSINPAASVNLIMLSNYSFRFWWQSLADIRWKKVIKKMWDNRL